MAGGLFTALDWWKTFVARTRCLWTYFYRYYYSPVIPSLIVASVCVCFIATDEEKYRNADGSDYLFFLTSHPIVNFASYLYLNDTINVNWSALTDVGETHMMHGFIRGYPSAFIPGAPPLLYSNEHLTLLVCHVWTVRAGKVKPKLVGHKEFHNASLSAEYKNPIDRPHLCQLLPGLTPPRMTPSFQPHVLCSCRWHNILTCYALCGDVASSCIKWSWSHWSTIRWSTTSTIWTSTFIPGTRHIITHPQRDMQSVFLIIAMSA